MATKRVQLIVTDQRFFDDAQNKREAVRVWSLPWKLPYWIEKWDAQNEQAKVWIKVPKIPANGSVDLYIYYGNPSAVSESDPEAVFEFFDDFTGESLDPRWALNDDTQGIPDEWYNADARFDPANDRIILYDGASSGGKAAITGLSLGNGFYARFRIVQPEEMLNFVFFGTTDARNRWEIFWNGYMTDKIYIREAIDGTLYTRASKSGVGSLNGTFEIYVTPNKIEVYCNGVLWLSYSGTITKYGDVYGFSAGGGDVGKYAYLYGPVLFCKYADQEPVVNISSEEEESDVPGWLYRRKITIHNPNDYDLHHFQVAIDLDGSNFDFTKANADGSDIRITYASARYSLPYYIETWDTSTPQAVIWVGIDSETRFFVELNPNNTTDESDPTVMDLPEATNYTLAKFERYTGGG